MSTHAAGRRHAGNFADTSHRAIPGHARSAGQPRWWNTDRGRALARDIGDFVDDLVQVATVAITALVLLGVAALAVAALWEINQPAAVAVAGVVVVAAAGALGWLWRDRRRP